MANSTSLIAPVGISGSDIRPAIPAGPISLSDSDLAKTLPFNESDVSRELKATILKRTQQRQVWFTKAQEQDEERGTKLGTLGFLPWEIRQMIIEKVFDGHFYELLCDQYPQSVTLENYDSPSIFVEFTTKFLTHFQSVKSLEDASASTKIEVEHTFLTKTKFKFYGCDNVKYFLGRLTTYQRSLLRSVDICEEDSSTLKDKTWMDVYAQLPSGLTSVNFELCLLLGNGLLIYRGGGYRPNSKVSGFLDLLGKRIKRCWAPRANTNIQCIYSDYSRWNNVAHVAFAYEVEEWSRDWLQWWEKSQDGDQVEEQSSITDHSGFS